MSNNILTPTEIHYLMNRFPKIELSYETNPHKKVSPNYNVCIAIPIGIKCYAWLTFYGKLDVCFIMELNKNKKIAKVYYMEFKTYNELAHGTLLYGTLINNTAFIIEDIFYAKGVPMRGLYYGEKLGYIENLFANHIDPDDYILPENKISINEMFPMKFYLPALWSICNQTDYECMYDIPTNLADNYPVHHIQYRCLNTISPYLNIYPCRKGFGQTVNVPAIPLDILIPYRGDYSKPQYKMITIFKVMADLQFDVYNLFAYGKNRSSIYYNVAYIPNYKTSVFMNNIFRKIKENQNLDAIEESDDESDFENTDIDKYVDLKKHVFMECRFNPKFKKWVPLRIVDPHQKVVHIGSL